MNLNGEALITGIQLQYADVIAAVMKSKQDLLILDKVVQERSRMGVKIKANKIGVQIITGTRKDIDVTLEGREDFIFR